MREYGIEKYSRKMKVGIVRGRDVSRESKGL